MCLEQLINIVEAITLIKRDNVCVTYSKIRKKCIIDVQ